MAYDFISLKSLFIKTNKMSAQDTQGSQSYNVTWISFEAKGQQEALFTSHRLRTTR
jgi:hypothetical protein